MRTTKRNSPSVTSRLSLERCQFWPLLAGIFLLAAPAVAQECAADGAGARVCSIRLLAALENQRPVELDPRRPVALPMGAELTLEIYAYDQYGRDFPRQRLWFGLETDYACRGLIETERMEASPGFRVRAGARQGSCQARLWVPGNLNLEWPIVFEVAARARQGYSRGEAEYLVAGLYVALLGRSPDPGGLAANAVQIQRGALAEVINGLLASPEFRSYRADKAPARMLDQIYLGLLGRPVDTPGVRAYLGAAERGDFGSIVWELVRTEEFERRLLEQADSR